MSGLSRRPTNIPRYSLGGQQKSDNFNNQRQNARKSMAPSTQYVDRENVNPNRRSSIGRNSMGRQSMSRRSSVFPDRGVQKDPRNLSDKDYRKECITKIVRYLTENGYDHPISYKLLTSPVMKDFLRIFRFLYNQLDPYQKFTSPNFAEEIPMLMKELGYPFTINKSALLAWTPRTWPCLLGCLVWLVELCVYFKEVGQSCFYPAAGDNFEEDDEPVQKNINQTFFEYLSKAYVSYLEGDDDFENTTEIESFAERNEALQTEYIQVNMETEDLSSQWKEMQEKPSRLDVLQSTKEDLISDKKKFNNIVDGYQSQLNQYTRKESEVTDLLHQKESEFDAMTKEMQLLQNILETQELSQTDVERMNNDREQLKKDLNGVKEHKEETQKQNWEKEKAIKLAWDSLDKSLHNYHQKAQKLHLIPGSAKNANDIDFELHLNREDPDPQNMLSVELKGTIKPGLSQIKEAYMSNIVSLKEEVATLEDHLEQVIECDNEKQEEIKLLDMRLEKAKSLHKTEKEEYAVQEREMLLVVEDLEEKVQKLRTLVSDSKMERLQADFEHEGRQYERQIEDLHNEIFTAVDLASSHKEHIVHRLSKLKKTTSMAVLKFKELIEDENLIQ